MFNPDDCKIFVRGKLAEEVKLEKQMADIEKRLQALEEKAEKSCDIVITINGKQI